MNIGTASVIRGDARNLPLADNTVDLVVTSPPYFALRSYQDGGEHYEGQIGSEPTPAEFVDALLEVTRECVRVLKPSGSLWVNLGDKYAGSRMDGSSDNGTGSTGLTGTASIRQRSAADGYGSMRSSGAVRQKSLIGIPWRYALRCIDDLGLILRAEVIWSKPNGLPESVTDRVRRSHEQWFHFTLEPRYFSAVDEIREAHEHPRMTHIGPRSARGEVDGNAQHSRAGNNPLGKLPGSVWTAEGDESLVRSVLSAVSVGALTIDEGERVLWAQRERASWHTSTAPATAGSGSDGKTLAATGKPPTSAPEARTGPTASPTGCSSVPSPTGSPSTTHAATSPASTQGTSSQSPSPRTSPAHTPSVTPAHAATHSPTHTPSAPATGSSPSAAAPATRTGRSDVAESVWQVPTEPLRVPEHLGVDHFAAFPTEFPKRIIAGWSPAGVCVECGEGRRPVAVVEHTKSRGGRQWNVLEGGPEGSTSMLGHESIKRITGYACACPEPTAPTTPAVVLDPFGGTGTTAMVAKALGRHGISVDMSADYCRLAEWRTTDRNQLAKVLGVGKVAAPDPEQLDLFGGVA